MTRSRSSLCAQSVFSFMWSVRLQVPPRHAVAAPGRGVRARHLLVGADQLGLLLRLLGLLLRRGMLPRPVVILLLFLLVHDFSARPAGLTLHAREPDPLSRGRLPVRAVLGVGVGVGEVGDPLAAHLSEGTSNLDMGMISGHSY